MRIPGWSQMKKDVEDGCAREAEAQARQLAEEAGCALRASLFHVYAAKMLSHACLWVVVHRSIKLKEQFVAMVSHEARVQRAPSFFAF